LLYAYWWTADFLLGAVLIIAAIGLAPLTFLVIWLGEDYGGHDICIGCGHEIRPQDARNARWHKGCRDYYDNHQKRRVHWLIRFGHLSRRLK